MHSPLSCLFISYNINIYLYMVTSLVATITLSWQLPEALLNATFDFIVVTATLSSPVSQTCATLGGG